MRRELRTRSRIVTAPRPSMLAGRASSVTMCSCRSCSSAASSIVTIRSSAGINDDSTFNVVVFPDPVPPEMTIFSFPSTQAFSKSAISCVSVSISIRSWILKGSRANFRMVSAGPVRASGGIMALTREPSGNRASTIGELSSIRRPMGETIFSMMCITWTSSRK